MDEDDTSCTATVSRAVVGQTRRTSHATQSKPLYDRAYQWITTGPPMILTWAMLRVFLTLFVMTSVAVFIYGSFYYTYIPRSATTRQLHFERTELTKVYTHYIFNISLVFIYYLVRVVPPLVTDTIYVNNRSLVTSSCI